MVIWLVAARVINNQAHVLTGIGERSDSGEEDGGGICFFLKVKIGNVDSKPEAILHRSERGSEGGSKRKAVNVTGAKSSGSGGVLGNQSLSRR